MKKKTNEIIMYSSETCNYCAELKKQFNEKEIKYTEVEKEKNERDWYKVVDLTGLALLPTVIINDKYFVAGRDFGNPEQLINIIEYVTGPEYKKVPSETKVEESIKTFNYNINMFLTKVFHKLNSIEEKLNKKEE